jgi:hypothetical protein
MLPKSGKRHTFDLFATGYLLIKVPRVTLSREDDTNHAILPHGCQLT